MGFHLKLSAHRIVFIICLDYVLRTSIDPLRDYGFTLKEKRSGRYPASYKTDADYADDLALISNTIEEAATLLHSLEKAASKIRLQINAKRQNTSTSTVRGKYIQ